MPRVVHTHSLPESILAKREANILDNRHKKVISLNKNQNRYTGIIDWRYQSRITCNITGKIILKLSGPLTKEREPVGTAMAPTTAKKRSPTMDKISPTCHHQGVPNQQHSLCHTKSNTMAKHLRIFHWRLQ